MLMLVYSCAKFHTSDFEFKVVCVCVCVCVCVFVWVGVWVCAGVSVWVCGFCVCVCVWHVPVHVHAFVCLFVCERHLLCLPISAIRIISFLSVSENAYVNSSHKVEYNFRKLNH